MFTCCANLPGKFMLSYLIKLQLRNEYIKVTPQGFKFREKLFASFNELLAWFKTHFADPIPKPAMAPPPPQQQVSKQPNISSQMDTMSLTPQHQSQAYRTPNYTPPNRTPQSNNNTFDNSQEAPMPTQPAQYSTASFDNSYSAPISNNNRYGDHRGNGRGLLNFLAHKSSGL